ncbi:carboxypeptidase [bacterium CG17_big_fil_post_rev_8_21_14_2_50_64_8]|nr:MAG: carboxypeptidase [bacterium CG17_big_fil_post_rev_8_21_14_2_50_64_8]PJA75135.1 MAG: carboxypeptidase [bacterium CG_4_9_14_3_um_filter_65_15]
MRRMLPLLLLPALLWSGCGEPVPGDSATNQSGLNQLVRAGLDDTYAYDLLGDLCTTVGPRLAGSPGYERAVVWAQEAMRRAGCDSVWVEPVTVPHWTRGREWGRVLGPVPFDLDLCALGLSDGTGDGEVEAEILAVRDFDELERRADEAAGKIVLFNPPWEGYGKTVRYRVGGASAAARHGAVACLICSVTDRSLGAPHTGMMRYADDAPRIPIAAVTVENADRLFRMAGRGMNPRVRLHLEAANHEDVTNFNVIGEIRGSEAPEEIILVAGHLDSWDVGTGASDDGTGVTLALAAARLQLQQDRRPRRTIRVVFYACEEMGGFGGRAYLEAHRQELDRHVLVMESDGGGFAPRGFSVQADSTVVARVAELAAPLARIAPDHWSVGPGGSGVDVGPLAAAGVPGIGHHVDGSGYFALHHSRADTYDKVDPDEMARNTAAIAGLIYSVDHLPERLLPPRAAGGNP